MNVLGIDPGRNGGICVLSITRPREIIALENIPILEDGQMDAKSLATFLDLHRMALKFCVIEKVSAMVYTDKSGQVRGQGAAASFNFGKGFGVLLGCLHSASIPVIEVAPSVWKILLNLSSAKSDSINRAHELYPASRARIKLKKHDGIAEALLLAHFGAERFGNIT